MIKQVILIMYFTLIITKVINANTLTTNADIQIFNTLTISPTLMLNFGNIALNSVDSVIKVTTSETIVESGDAIVTKKGHRAVIAFQGDVGVYIATSVQPTVNLTNGIDTLVANIRTYTTGGGITTTAPIGGAFLEIVGSITVPANSSLGEYTGSFIVNYNY